MMQIARVSTYQSHDGTWRLEIAASNGYEMKTFHFQFKDEHQGLNAAEKLRLVGNTMLRDAPRPKP